MSTLEEKILDGPQVHYCDAGDDDIRVEDQDDLSDSGEGNKNEASSLFKRPDVEEEERLGRISQVKWRGGSTNTGPKGVIEDFKKRSTSKGSQDAQANDLDEIEAEFQELLNDDHCLKEYIAKRISDAIKTDKPTFGRIVHLRTGDQLLDSIDKENPNVLVIVHIYTKYSRSCSNLNRCLDELARELKHIKFVTLDASVTNLSSNFKENGVPALLAYKKGVLVKSLIQLEEQLDRDFDSSQVRELLIDNGLINL